MNWLARLEVDTDIARDKNIWDSYVWHKKIWEDCFPDAPNAERDFLTRIDQLEGSFQVWILGTRKPVCPQWCIHAGFSIKKIAPSFLAHRYYAFDLRANPVKAMVQRDANGEALLGPNGKRKRGKRVPLIKQKELHDWLVRKGKIRCHDDETGVDVPGGFRIVEDKPLEISPMVENHFRKKERAGYHGGVRFRGTLEVTDQKSFIETYKSGIGSAKSFGFGLLLLAPIDL